MTWFDVRSKGLYNIPGMPKVDDIVWLETGEKLRGRKKQTQPARNGLTRKYIFTGEERALEARSWLFAEGGSSKKIRMGPVSLEDPKQFMISWTTYKNQCDPGADDELADGFAKELTDANATTSGFWRRIAKFGTGYNLPGILRKVSAERFRELKALLEEPPHRASLNDFQSSPWQARFESLQKDGRFYEIDLSLFEDLPPRWYLDGSIELFRYNPGTLTLLEMTDKKELLPVLIRVFSKQGWIKKPGKEIFYPDCSEVYSPEASTKDAWLYALQAAKTSVTLYGIWLGHVYHWHLVPAAMIRTMNEAIRDMKHPVQLLLQPQSKELIEFNYFLLGDQGVSDAYGQIAPPTSMASPQDVLRLEDKFAKDRNFFDDDPKNELAKNGIAEADFTDKKAWDLFPAAQNLFRIWDICENFVKAFVSNTYLSDAAVVADKNLQKWMENAAKPDQGNIRGLPELNTRDALIRLLTSLVYRLTAHGVSRLPRSTDPWLTFVANFPPCLQRTDLPPPNADIGGTKELLKYLPNVRTIADTLAFYFAFAYSKPYVSLIPAAGSDKELYFPNKPPDARNNALIEYRNKIQEFINDYTDAQLPPGYHKSSDPKPWLQWPRSIET